jgi:hypothetical protein
VSKQEFWNFLEEAYPSIASDPTMRQTFHGFFNMVWDTAYAQGATDMYDREEETLGAHDKIISVILK